MFSPLQKHILKICYAKKEDKVGRNLFLTFYKEKKVKKESITRIITNSLERLIARGVLIGYGIKTSEKWYIKEVKLTLKGIKKWEKWLIDRQARLPF